MSKYKFKNLELLITNIIEATPSFFRGDIILKCNKYTLNNIYSSVEEYMCVIGKGIITTDIKILNINGIVIHFEEDLTIPNDVTILKYNKEDE